MLGQFSTIFTILLFASTCLLLIGGGSWPRLPLRTKYYHPICISNFTIKYQKLMQSVNTDAVCQYSLGNSGITSRTKGFGYWWRSFLFSRMFLCTLENFGIFTAPASDIPATSFGIVPFAGSSVYVACCLMLTFTFATSSFSFHFFLNR